MTQGVSTAASDQRRRQMRRVCARARSVYRRIDRICGRARDADVVVDEVARIVVDSRSLLHSIEGASLVPIQLRDVLDQAVIGLDQLCDYTQIPVDICNPLKAALRAIERHVESLDIDSPSSNSSEGGVVRRIVGRVAEHPIFAGSLASAGGLVAVVATVLILATGTSVTLRNINCGDLADSSTEQFVESAIDLIPGIDIPSVFPVGSETAIRLPDAFVGEFEVIENPASLRVGTSNGDRTINVGGLDLLSSTWDGLPLADFIGNPTRVSGDHSLVLECFK